MNKHADQTGRFAFWRRSVLRPALAFATFLALAAAGLQGGGRIAMWLLEDFEGLANAYLDGRATVSGLAGGWKGLNPLVRIRRLDMPAGWAEGVLAELDWLETIRRSQLVLERLFVDEASLIVEHGPGGWQLAGMPPLDASLNWRTLLGDSDELRFSGQIRVAGAADSALQIEARGFNRDGRHWYDFSAQRPECAADCRLELRWRSDDRPRLVAEQLLQVSGALPVPDAYAVPLGLGGGFKLRVQGQWLARDGLGGGELRLHLAGIGLPGGAPAELAAELRSALRDGQHEGILSPARLAAGEAAMDFPPIRFRSDLGSARFWAESLPVAELAALLQPVLGASSAASEWLAAMAPGGRLLNLHASLGPQGVGYAATLDGLRLNPYRGVPWVRALGGELIGHSWGARLAFNAETLPIQFADAFEDAWQLNDAYANLEAWFRDGQLGLRVPYFRGGLRGSRIAGAFGLVRPADRFGQRISLTASADRMELRRARGYAPYHLPEALLAWLDQGLLGGELADVQLAYQGQVHTRPDDRSRRFAMQARVQGAEVRYHSDWPAAAEVQGWVEVAGADVHAQLDSARSLGAEIREAKVLVADNAAFAQVQLRAQAEATAGLNFVRSSPLAEWLPFVAPDWDGSGQLGLGGELFIPLYGVADSADARLNLELRDFGLVMPDYRLQFAALNGPAQYRFPHYLKADPLPLELFGRPARASVQSDQDSIDFQIQGMAAEADLYRLADMRDYGMALGVAPFDATLSLAVDDSASHLAAATDLVGLRIDLPGEFGKDASVPRPTELRLDFLEPHTAVQFRHGAMRGWLHVEDLPLRGALGLGGGAPPAVPPDADEVLLAGQVGEVDLGEWLAAAEGRDLPVPWRLAEIAVQRAKVETQLFENLSLSGASRGEAMTLEFASADLNGSLRSLDGQPWQLRIQSVVLPESEGEGDPLDVALAGKLPDADVVLDSVLIGEEDFGRWSFRMRRQPNGLLFADLQGDLKDTEIRAPEGVFWDAAANRSAAKVRLGMEDLAKVLPQWDYAPSLEAESALLEADLSWPGSPLNVEVNGLRGELSLQAENGRFVEVSSGGGALRIFSLLNFNTVFKRMKLDFKDVAGKGLSFDSIEARTRFDDGTLRFLEPAEVKGSGSDFKIGGSVNLVEGLMNDNEMIVTLPISDSLPWYAVYISLANPAAGLAVLAGQQVLKKQIKQFSSAKYQISGPWDDPQVKLVGIWDDDVQAFHELPEGHLGGASAAAEEGGP